MTLERASTTGRHSNELTASVGILNRFPHQPRLGYQPRYPWRLRW